MISKILLNELESILRATHGDAPVIPLAGGSRKALCFRGDTAQADALNRLDTLSTPILHGPIEVLPDTWCIIT